MAHHTAALKSIRQTAKRRARNIYRLTALRNACKEVENALNKNDAKEAAEALKKAQSTLAKGVKTGVIKAGNASRKVSRLNTRVKDLATGKVTVKSEKKVAPKKAAAPKAAKKAAAKK